jgi:hypothetical protein
MARIILNSDTDQTPLAASRFKKFMSMIGPAAGGVLQKIVDNAVKDGLPLKINNQFLPYLRVESDLSLEDCPALIPDQNYVHSEGK